jgi:transposase
LPAGCELGRRWAFDFLALAIPATLFSALYTNSEGGRCLTIIGTEGQTPRRQDVHLILDNYGTHKHPTVKTWLAEHPRFRFHFTPTGASWLNLVERFFAEITRKRIRRGTFRSVPALIAAIRTYVREHNKDPRPFIWTASASAILRKIRRCKEALETGH